MDLIKSLFSKNVKLDLKNFDNRIEQLLDYIEVGGDPSWHAIGQIADGKRDSGQKTVIVTSSYDVKTDKDPFRFCLKVCSTDEIDKNNIGILSLYVIKKQDDTNTDDPYWGDGKETPGINIGIPSVEK